MRKRIWIAVLSCVLFTAGCMKGDYNPGPGKVENCTVEHYNGIPYDGMSFGNDMDITYDEAGLIKSVHTFIAANFEFVDEVDYTMTWTKVNGGLIATIQAKKKFWTTSLGTTNGLEKRDIPDESYQIKAWFDSKKGLTKIEGPSDPTFPFSFVMTYASNGRLLKFGNFELEYDAKGNVTRVPKIDGSGHGAVIYSYDLSKKIGKQFYMTSGYNVTECYNLAELCGWIPVQPNNVRTGVTFSWGNVGQEDYIAGNHTYTEHKVQGDYLKSYKVTTSGETAQSISNIWNCKIFNIK